MEILLEELYKTDIYVEKFHFRKLFLDNLSYQINGITQSGKTKIVKNYLLGLKKNSYLYINCRDLRIDIDALNSTLQDFCTHNQITTLVLDDYRQEIKIFNVPQLIICCEVHYKIDFLQTLKLYPLDYEEFLAYEHKYDSSALNHFFQLGGFAFMHKVNSDERVFYLQKALKSALEEKELEILIFCAKMMTQKVSPTQYTRGLNRHKKYPKTNSINLLMNYAKKGTFIKCKKQIIQKQLEKSTSVTSL